MKLKLEIYALAVCFASVVCIVIASGIAGYSILEIVVPELTINAYSYKIYQSNDSYWDGKRSCSEDKKSKIRPDEETLTKQRMVAFAAELAAERRRGLQTLIRCLMFLLASGVTLYIHWRIAARARE